jgi:hypothetical protein
MTRRPSLFLTVSSLFWATALVLPAPARALEVPADAFASQRRFAVVVEASVSTAPPAISLHLLDGADNQPYEVRRRLWGEVEWGALLATLPAGTSTWTDFAVVPGTLYEYQVKKDLGGGEWAFGYLASGLDVDRTGYRGRLILLIDETLAGPLAAELDRLEDDLVGDGWRVLRQAVPRAVGWEDSATSPRVPIVKQAVLDAWNGSPVDDRPKLLFLLGHVPIARSGLDGESPDDHDENRGAHATDTFYADIDGLWTDAGTAPGGQREFHANAPGDGKFDQDFLPSALELGFGRVDFADLGGFYPATTEVELLRRYLDKLHAHRWVRPGSDAGRRSLFGTDGFVESVEMCWRTYPGISGAANTEATSLAAMDAVGGPVAYVAANGPYLLFAQNLRVPVVEDHIALGSNALVWSSDQSYFGLWGRPNPEMRAALASPGLNLAWVWHVAPKYVFTDMAMGETLGEAVRRTIEHRGDYLLWERPPRDFDDPPTFHRQYMSLLADPSLRFFQVASPSEVRATVEGAQVALSWRASPAADLVGYHVYRSTSRLGPFTRLTTQPVSGLTFVDSAAQASERHYRVQAVRRETSGGGTFLNPSLAVPTRALEALFGDGFESGSTGAWSATVP